MNLLDSLLDAIVRLHGDALVMHVGEKPYVVTTAEAASEFRGPLSWGQVELSSRVLTLQAVTGMLQQILPADQRSALDEYGAIEYDVASGADTAERFRIVAARGGDDVWLEVRRQPKHAAAAAPEPSPVHAGTPAPEPDADTTPLATTDAGQQAEPPLVPATPTQPAPVAAGAETVLPAPPDGVSVPREPAPVPSTVTAIDEEPALSDHDMDHDHVLLSAEDWGDEVMTEGDLGELLRASAAAVISGDADPADSPPGVLPPGFGVLEIVDTHALDDDHDEEVEISLDHMRAASLEHLTQAAVRDSATDPVRPPDFDLPRQPETVSAGHGLPLDEHADLLHPPVFHLDYPEPDHEVADFRDESLAQYVPEASAGGVPPSEPAREAVSAQPEVAPVPAAAETPTPIHAADPAADAAAAVMDEDDHLESATTEEPGRSRPALVVPLTRHGRGEAAADLRSGVGTLERVLRLAAARGAGALYLVADAIPMVRIDGEFSPLEDEPAFSAALVDRLTADLAPHAGDESAAGGEWTFDVQEIGRVRWTSFRDHRGPGLIFRLVPPRAIAADQLALPAEVQALCSEADGLVLVAGGRGSGKSTLLTSFVDLINRTRSDHVITTESQIDFLHENKRSFISQREIRGDADAVAAAVRAATREDPDVLIIEDLRTPELVTLALETAQTGRLVFASVPAPSALSAVERMIEMFPPERREKLQASLAGTLRGIVSQVLLRRLRGGRVAAREVLLNTPAVANLILEGKTFQLPAALEGGRKLGMMPLAESLAALVREGVVHPSHAYRKAPNREQFLSILRRDGLDTSVAERLA